MTGKLAYITTTFDLVSHLAFQEEKVRKASYKEPFSHWLPLYINKEHGARAVNLAKQAMAKICEDCYGSFRPEMVLEVIPKLMNTMVVSMMSKKLYASIMALEGYCAFHHLFLMFMEEYPELKKVVDSTIQKFISYETFRNKKDIPALGEWIPLLTVTETYGWKDVSEAYLLEMFDRNVLWSLKKYPELQTEKGPAYYDQRLKKVFDATIVSNRLLMFHVYFLKHIARPDGVSIQQIRGLLDFRCGRPTYQMKDQLQEECKSIQKVEHWTAFFKKIYVTAPTKEMMARWLERCVSNSLKKGYHHPSWLLREETKSKSP